MSLIKMTYVVLCPFRSPSPTRRVSYLTSGPEQGLIGRGEIAARLPTTRDSGNLLPMTLWPHDDPFPPPVRTQASCCYTMRPSEQRPGMSVQNVSRGLSQAPRGMMALKRPRKVQKLRLRAENSLITFLGVLTWPDLQRT